MFCATKVECSTTWLHELHQEVDDICMLELICLCHTSLQRDKLTVFRETKKCFCSVFLTWKGLTRRNPSLLRGMQYSPSSEQQKRNEAALQREEGLMSIYMGQFLKTFASLHNVLQGPPKSAPGDRIFALSPLKEICWVFRAFSFERIKIGRGCAGARGKIQHELEKCDSKLLCKVK